MITRVEALNFRCLRYVHRPMNPFHVLVGPNASGKTTFLDVIGLLGDIVSGGLDYALSERTPNPQDLLFGRRGSRLELAVEATVPDALRQPGAQQWNTVRYQVALGYDDTDRQFEFKAETLLLKKATESGPSQRELFPTPPAPPESLLDSIKQRDNKVLVNKASGGNDNFYNESSPANRSWAPSFKLGTQRSALGQPSGRPKLVSDGDVVSGVPWRRHSAVHPQQWRDPAAESADAGRRIPARRVQRLLGRRPPPARRPRAPRCVDRASAHGAARPGRH